MLLWLLVLPLTHQLVQAVCQVSLVQLLHVEAQLMLPFKPFTVPGRAEVVAAHHENHLGCTVCCTGSRVLLFAWKPSELLCDASGFTAPLTPA